MTPIQALLGFAAWTLLLIAGVFLYRGMRFLTGTPINHWPRGNKPADDAPFVKRLEDAHANCLENLPGQAAVLLFAMLAGQTALTDPLALGLLAARVLQSLVHLLSTAPLFVWLRFASYLVQVLILAWWLLQLSGLL